MTWTKLSGDFADRPGILSVPRGVRFLHVEALLWSNVHNRDGNIPHYVLGRITDEPEPHKAAELLVNAGIWKETAEGWLVVDSLEDQPTAEDEEKKHALWRMQKRRQRQHRSGVHDLCDPRYCRQSRVHVDKGAESAVESSHNRTDTEPTRTEPSRKSEGREGEGGDEGSLAGGSLAPPRPEGETPSKPTCPKCGSQWPYDRIKEGTIPRDKVCKRCRPTSPRAGWMTVERIADELGKAPEYILDEDTDEVQVSFTRAGLHFWGFAGVTDTGVWISIEHSDGSTWPENEPLPDERFHNRALRQGGYGDREYTPPDAFAIAQHWHEQTKDRP
jgi:hypothetical protein